ncbi:MAG: ferrochelatase [Actinomycetota bacterium]|nr:ferrochelatase [Actinomycetota bacterium]
MSGRLGVLVMAHGTPGRPEDIAAFYTRIRRGNPPPAALLHELQDRYRAIGGTSPLAERTHSQVDGLAAALDRADPGRWAVRFGAKHTDPSIEDAVAALADAGVTRAVAVVLAPHFTGPGTGEYLERARTAADAAGIELVLVPSWHRASGLADLLGRRVVDALARRPEGTSPGETHVLFTAHSVPVRVVDAGDPYPRQVAESAADAAGAAGLDASGIGWSVAWQSAGRTADPWVGPDILEEIRRLAGTGRRAVIVCPVGFVADHLEVLYDIDVEAAAAAAAAGLSHLGRTRSLNDDPEFLALLAEVVRGAGA